MVYSPSGNDANRAQGSTLDSLNYVFDKITSTDVAVSKTENLPRPMVFTNGVFDILHRGHVTYLAAARDLGAVLVVGINTDKSARGLGKGDGRPFNTQDDRAVLLAGLASVGMVTFFDEPTPCELIERLRPDIYVKGGDYDMETLSETSLVRSWGGKSLALPFLDGFSTTSLARRMGKI